MVSSWAMAAPVQQVITRSAASRLCTVNRTFIVLSILLRVIWVIGTSWCSKLEMRFVEVQRVTQGSRTQGTKDAFAFCFSVVSAVNCERFCNMPFLVLFRELQSMELRMPRKIDGSFPHASAHTEGELRLRGRRAQKKCAHFGKA